MRNEKIKRMVGIALLMAIVAVLQLLGQFIKFGPVSVSLVLLPIVVGAAFYGPLAGGILGATFSIVVLAQPDTSFFYSLSAVGTVVVVMLKGTLSGWLSGLTYKALENRNSFLAVLLSAIVCPLVNTGIFFLGCITVFAPGLEEMASGNVVAFVLTAFIGVNFVAEFLVNLLCCPVVVRLIHAVRKIHD